MRIEFKPATDPPGDAWTIRVKLPGQDEPFQIGTAHNLHNGTFRIDVQPLKKDGEPLVAAMSMTLEADCIDDLVETVTQRMADAEASQEVGDRLTDETMATLTHASVINMARLANKCEALQGFVSGLALALRTFLEMHVRDERYEEFMGMLSARVLAGAKQTEGTDPAATAGPVH